jgi:hypothetical protein
VLLIVTVVAGVGRSPLTIAKTHFSWPPAWNFKFQERGARVEHDPVCLRSRRLLRLLVAIGALTFSRCVVVASFASPVRAPAMVVSTEIMAPVAESSGLREPCAFGAYA